jgi:hypothetical protein
MSEFEMLVTLLGMLAVGFLVFVVIDFITG